jgi:hypothetical protein
MTTKSNTQETTKTSGVRVFKRNAQSKIDPATVYAERASAWDDATLNHCLDMIEEGKMTMPFKIRIVEAEAASRGLGDFVTV